MRRFKPPFREPPLKNRLSPNRQPTNVLQFNGAEHRSSGIKAWLQRNWPYAALIASPLVGIGVAWFWQVSPPPEGLSYGRAEQYEVSFSRCSGPVRVTCVVDGDTIWLNGQKIRIADINTPEIGKPECPAERALGEQATNRLIVLLNQGGISLQSVDRDEDPFGRKLRIITRGGESLGSILVSEGLAERWTGSRRSWC